MTTGSAMASSRKQRGSVRKADRVCPRTGSKIPHAKTEKLVKKLKELRKRTQSGHNEQPALAEILAPSNGALGEESLTLPEASTDDAGGDAAGRLNRRKIS
jgi:hypothetical protein